MNDMNDQIMNFRKSLGLDELEADPVVKEKSEKATSEPSEATSKERVSTKQELKRKPGESDRPGLGGGRTTITIPAELLGKMKLLSFWMTREGMSRNMSMSQMVMEMFECYLDSFDGARGFVEKNVD